ncbi:hypothetical protein B0H14DRAFT_2605689 [Mycena olivaceomarginata]|nr:hypothetical protein B0H14DRAFT_2605689 [Mycena olivaceomarginata]
MPCLHYVIGVVLSSLWPVPRHFGGPGEQWFDMLWEEIGGLMFLGEKRAVSYWCRDEQSHRRKGVVGEETDDLVVPGSEEYVCARPMQSFGGAIRRCTMPSMSTNLTAVNHQEQSVWGSRDLLLTGGLCLFRGLPFEELSTRFRPALRQTSQQNIIVTAGGRPMCTLCPKDAGMNEGGGGGRTNVLASPLLVLGGGALSAGSKVGVNGQESNGIGRCEKQQRAETLRTRGWGRTTLWYKLGVQVVAHTHLCFHPPISRMNNDKNQQGLRMTQAENAHRKWWCLWLLWFCKHCGWGYYVARNTLATGDRQCFTDGVPKTGGYGLSLRKGRVGVASINFVQHDGSSVSEGRC